MNTKLHRFFYIFFILSFFCFTQLLGKDLANDSIAHEAHSSDNNKMERKDNNFTSFTVQKKEHLEEWKKYNDPKYYSHPDFGITQPEAPCATCIEVLEKRTIDSKYYINYEKPSEFYIQKGIGEFFHKENDNWVTIDDKLKPVSGGLYQSNFYLEPVGIDVNAKQSYILTPNGKVFFNNWHLLSETNDVEVMLDDANWSDYTIGDDGIYIKNIFKGIDAQLLVYRGAVKTNFVMKKNEYGEYGNLIFRDTYQADNSTSVKFIEDEKMNVGVGALNVYSGDKSILQVKEGVMYPKGGTKENGQLAAYKITGNNADILVPLSWIKKYINDYELIIDPLVSGSATLAQASITGSMYNASCNFTNYCNYNLTVAAPANATFTNVLWSFNYIAVTGSLCWLQDGACRFTRGGCVSPNMAGFYWYCNLVGAGTCTGANVSIWSDVAACMPAPACVPQNVSFTMQFFRSCWGAAGCSNTCIGANSPWTMTIQGHTVEFANAVTPITLSSNTICQGQSVNVSTAGTYGVPGYTYNWSLAPGGAPSAGAGSNVSINFPTQGAYTIYSFITDACGIVASASIPVTVNQAVTTNANIDQTVCAGSSITLAGSVTGGAGTGTWSAPSGSFAPNATTLNATYTPSIASGTVTLTLTSADPAGPCPATTDQMVVTVTPQTVPTFAPIGPLCQNSVPPVLPTSSTNLPAITGAWNAAISTAVVGTIVYTFTPTAGQCATTTTLSITVNPQITPTFAAIPNVCQFAAAPVLPLSSTNLPAITGTWAPAVSTAIAGTTVYTFTPTAGQCATTTTLSITVDPQITPTFAAIPNVCQFAAAPVLPLSSTNLPAITGTWAPAVSTAIAGTTVYTFTPTAGQCATTTTLSITVDPQITPTFAAIPNVCQFAAAPVLPLSSTNLPAITGTWAPAVSTAIAGTTVYTFTPTAGQCATTTTLSITVDPQITPTFAAIPNVCQFAAVPVLPLSSTNLPAITGTWAPAVSTAVAGTTVYTFTPTAGQCATTTTLSITVDPQITPTFAAIPNVCQFAPAPVLPLSSTNLPAITGTWAPAVSTAIAGTTVYTFTPTAGQCATTTTLSITVAPQITPTFATIPNVCQFAAAPVLPLSSTNLPAITGTWAPAVSTAVAGTTVYTFTPTAGQCATTTTLSITVDPQITPTFAAIPNVCQFAPAPVLPLSSTNLPAITGTWAPAVSTAVAGTTVYTFTPTAGQCATTTTLSITVDPQITPTFAAIPNVCQFAPAPVLPLSSTNFPAITGTWAPAVSTAIAGTTVYTFTPTAGQCATTTTLSITVDPQITPTFSAIPNVCQFAAALVLPLSSTNLPAITGTWAPAVSTAVAGTTVYTFTPTAGQCATTTTLSITVDPQITPTFAAIPNVCQFAAAPVLPLSSTNLPAITGTWAPAVSTSVAGTTLYTFTPTAGQCATTTTLSITVDPQITPTFAAIPNVCQFAAAPVLPLSSTNLPAITGTWAPAVSTAVAGTTVYTFTPTAGQCATTTTLNITVDAQITPTFAAIPNVCLGSAAPVLPLSSTNLPAITGTWAPAVSTAVAGTTVYTFTPTVGQCATTTTLSITVNPQVTPTFAAIPNVCQFAGAPVLPLSSTNLPAISGTWAPAVSTAVSGTTVYTFTPTAGQCATSATSNITVDPQITPSFTAIGQLCQNSVAPVLPTSSNDLPAITGTWNAPVSTTVLGNTVYTFTPTAGQCATTVTMTINVTNQITPTFAAIPNICQGGVASALPASSTNLPAINGTWLPAVINTAAAGTTAYTFTPFAGQCAIPTIINITIDPVITPTFTAIPNVCQNSLAPVLPLSSTNLPAITGTWAPAISTAVAGTTVYTFTPTAGQCATSTTLPVTLDATVTPTFAAIPNVCQNGVAPVLPLTSTNLPAINGTWLPVVSTAVAGTTVYTFTPSAGQCATTTTLSITVDAQITPSFTAIGQLCQNSVAPLLPTSSNDLPAITGTWNAAINTTILGNTVYTFTPSAGQCATSASLTVNITNQITPTFTAVPNICQGALAPVLPASSTNLPAITGTWAPAVVSTAAAGTTLYTFTPNAGQCAIPASMNITVDAQVTPTFTQIGPLCQNSVAPALPTSSNDLPAITGTWNAAISTTNLGNTVYTFTPAAGQCATTTTMTVNITTQIVPTFAAIPNVCQGGVSPVLPLSSTNLPAIVGVWNATVSTAVAGTFPFTFTPNPGQCAIPTTINVTINPLITPTFAAVGPVCQNTAAPLLPTSSTNLPAITGTWAPAVSTTTAGTTVYTFTPTAGQCATTTTISITVDPVSSATINYSSLSYCNSLNTVQNVLQTGTPGGTYSAAPAGLSINPANGSISPNLSQAGVYTVTYTIPASGSCPPVLTTTNVTIAPLPVVSFTASPVSGCVPLCVTFTDNSPATSLLTAWSWNFGDGSPLDITQNPPLHCYTSTGTYSVSLTGTSAAGCSATMSSSNLINVLAIPTASFTAPAATSIQNPTVYFSDYSTANTSWFWDFGDLANPLTDTSNSRHPSYTYSQEGTYCVTLTVSNSGSCFDTAQVCVVIAGIYTLYIPNAFSPNDDGINDFFGCKGTNILDFEMYIYDRWGNTVYYANDINKPWDGKVHGAGDIAQQDVYVYLVKIKDNMKEDHEYIGNATIIK